MGAVLMQISEGDIHFAFVIVLSKDWHMCTPHITLKVVSKRMNIMLHSIIGYTLVVSIANFDCFAAV